MAAAKVNGVAVADGIYSGAAALHATQVDWIDGVGVVCVGHGVLGAAQVDATWTGGGSDTLSSTAANWNGAAPTLTDGGAYVTASGGTGFTAADHHRRCGGGSRPSWPSRRGREFLRRKSPE